jgi:hypothetical protein
MGTRFIFVLLFRNMYTSTRKPDSHMRFMPHSNLNTGFGYMEPLLIIRKLKADSGDCLQSSYSRSTTTNIVS